VRGRPGSRPKRPFLARATLAYARRRQRGPERRRETRNAAPGAAPDPGPEDFDRVDRVRAAADAVLVGLEPSSRTTRTSRSTRRTDASNGSGTAARATPPASSSTRPDGRRPTPGSSTTRRRPTCSSPRRRPRATRGACAAGAEVVVVEGGSGTERESESDGDHVDLVAGIHALAERGIDRLMVEGGGEVIYSCFAAGLVDELHVYVGSMVIGGVTRRRSPTVRGSPKRSRGSIWSIPSGSTTESCSRTRSETARRRQVVGVDRRRQVVGGRS